MELIFGSSAVKLYWHDTMSNHRNTNKIILGFDNRPSSTSILTRRDETTPSFVSQQTTAYRGVSPRFDRSYSFSPYVLRSLDVGLGVSLAGSKHVDTSEPLCVSLNPDGSNVVRRINPIQ